MADDLHENLPGILRGIEGIRQTTERPDLRDMLDDLVDEETIVYAVACDSDIAGMYGGGLPEGFERSLHDKGIVYAYHVVDTQSRKYNVLRVTEPVDAALVLKYHG